MAEGTSRKCAFAAAAHIKKEFLIPILHQSSCLSSFMPKVSDFLLFFTNFLLNIGFVLSLSLTFAAPKVLLEYLFPM
jgi:hypothetical protein